MAGDRRRFLTARIAPRRRSIVGVVAAVLAVAGGLVSAAEAALPTGVAPHYATQPVQLAPLATAAPTGLSPAAVKAAYGFSTDARAGAGETIAVVDPFDDPNIAADLAVFSATFDLPPCTTANRCFRKVDQAGGHRLPRPDAFSAVEIALDVEWVHAIAPGAKILLVEADDDTIDNLILADLSAARHADYVSNSLGTDEFPEETAYDPFLRQISKHASFFVSSGDTGVPSWPSTSPWVVSVGGTTLHFSPSGAVSSETGWIASGGGCSQYEPANPAQVTGAVSCGGMRATPDVAAVADPVSGVSIYDSYRTAELGVPVGPGPTAWLKAGGTSVSAPITAARAADRTSGRSHRADATLVYGDRITFRDATQGHNLVASCRTGYDLVTGRGSWLRPTP